VAAPPVAAPPVARAAGGPRRRWPRLRRAATRP